MRARHRPLLGGFCGLCFSASLAGGVWPGLLSVCCGSAGAESGFETRICSRFRFVSLPEPRRAAPLPLSVTRAGRGAGSCENSDETAPKLDATRRAPVGYDHGRSGARRTLFLYSAATEWPRAVVSGRLCRHQRWIRNPRNRSASPKLGGLRQTDSGSLFFRCEIKFENFFLEFGRDSGALIADFGYHCVVLALCSQGKCSTLRHCLHAI